MNSPGGGGGTAVLDFEYWFRLCIKFTLFRCKKRLRFSHERDLKKQTRQILKPQTLEQNERKKCWRSKRGSNSRPSACKADVITTTPLDRHTPPYYFCGSYSCLHIVNQGNSARGLSRLGPGREQKLPCCILNKDFNAKFNQRVISEYSNWLMLMGELGERLNLINCSSSLII